MFAVLTVGSSYTRSTRDNGDRALSASFGDLRARKTRSTGLDAQTMHLLSIVADDHRGRKPRRGPSCDSIHLHRWCQKI